MSRSVLFWLALLLVFSGAAAIRYASVALRGDMRRESTQVAEHRVPSARSIPGKPTMAGFQLTDQLGRTLDSDSLRGRVWVGSFFFASCPGACILQNQRVQLLEQKFGKRGLKIVSITCDPDRDTPAQLQKYSQDKFQADPDTWYFLTGDFEYIQRVGSDFFGVPVAKESHGSHLVLFDRQGVIQGAFGATSAESFDRLVKLLSEMLPESQFDTPADGVEVER